MRKLILLIITAVTIANYANAQRTTYYTEPLANYKLGLELFNKERYGQAQKIFKATQNLNAVQYATTISNAKYYEALCAYELFNNDAEALLSAYLKSTDKSVQTNYAQYCLANLYYRKKRYKEALPYFDKLLPTDISAELLPDYYFKKGYCFMEKKDLANAKTNFYEIKDADTKYSGAANYYYSHINYLQKNYQSALDGFLKLESNDSYKILAQYYVAQIMFLQDKHEQVIAYVPKLNSDTVSYNAKQQLELDKLMGNSYYLTEQYGLALPYLQRYATAQGTVSRYDYYALGNAYYQNKDYANSQYNLTQVRAENDSLTQLSSYTLGDCYVRNAKKKLARIAFERASKMEFNTEVQEDALFNFAKLSYELDINPYNESIKAFEKYLNTYPTAKHRDEVNSYLVNVYLNTKNYPAAMQSMDNINNKGKEIQYAYQRVAYYFAVQNYSNAKYADALTYFKKSDTYNLDKNISAQSSYWQAEAHYHLNDYDKAIDTYKQFIYMPAAVTQTVFNNAHYNLGYSYLQKINYPEAITWLRKFVAYKDENNQQKIADANLRIADAYFITKDLDNAYEYYENAIALNKLQVDYALYQSAVISGIQGKYDNNIKNLNRLVTQYPNSKYNADANYALANTQLTKGNNEEALRLFSIITDKYPNSSYYKKALLKKALIYFNTNNDEQALVLYKKIIRDYPATEEAKQALNGAQNILVEQGKPDEFAALAKDMPNANVSTYALDSITYLSAEKQYMRSDYENAAVGFGNYINKYPKGTFALSAAYYKGESEYKQNKMDDALASYALVTAAAKNKYTETALLKTARIYNKRDNKEYTYKAYEALLKKADQLSNINESKINLMYLSNDLKNNAAAITNASAVLGIEKLSTENTEMAHLIIAKNKLATADTAGAQAAINVLGNSGSKTLTATEARYLNTKLLFSAGKNEATEKAAYEIINQDPSYDVWVAKSFLILSDLFMRKNDKFSAKNTLQSIIDNSENADIIKEAKEKLVVINELEAQEEIKRLAQPKPQFNTPADQNVDELLLLNNEVPANTSIPTEAPTSIPTPITPTNPTIPAGGN
jgi:TolA-binding protein